MQANQIRQQFLDFFASKGHTIVPSAPIVVKNDPTLMFTNAGMNQFKDWFLGNEPAKYPRVANSQKCLRVSGKHNDLEDVGIDTYHHTMFEMLGNWSFGDYFKKEALAWAWELLTEVYQLDKDRLYVTVFEGDPKENLAFDQESYDIWKQFVPEERILRGNKKDNFWEMGDTGPCGPCSEIHYDMRPTAERAQTDGASLVNADHPQVIEIWNNVFMEFNRKADGSLEPLPAKHVDTGMGFERLCRAMQGKSSNYDTDVFTPLLDAISQLSGKKYGQDEKTDIAMRVIADHIRTVSFAIADGQLPSNNGAGYVIRRVLRRAVRYGFTFLGMKEPFFHKLAQVLAVQLKGVFNELESQLSFISQVIREEEISFLRTLETGIRRFEEYAATGTTNVNGKFAFELFDTYGFPFDLTALMARERGLQIDAAGFDTEMAAQKARSRAAAEVATGDWIELLPVEKVEFTGYDHTTETNVRIARYRKVNAKGKDQFQLVLDRTPFYAESGGQVGDSGFLISSNEKVRILDTQKENNLIIHLAERLPDNLESSFEAVVDPQRELTKKNHSATHLLHAALRQILGTHVEQKGSLVNSDYLRFDFSHFKAMSPEELKAVASLVNQKIRAAIPLDERRNVPLEEAKQMGAMALFGEKYGDAVRVITFDPSYSRELCGGTHVQNTGEIGFFKITSEGAVAAGVRRIEAVTADKAEELVNQQQSIVEGLKELLKAKDPVKSVEQLLHEKAELQKKLEQLEAEKTQGLKQELKQQVIAQQGIHVLISRIEIPNADQLKNLSFQLRNEIPNLFCVLGAVLNGKPMLSVIIDDELVKQRNLNAGQIVKDLAKNIQGGGGGQAFYATAGGSKLEGLDAALEQAKGVIG